MPTRRQAAAPAEGGETSSRPPAGPSEGTSPASYIARVSRRTGKEIEGPLAPDELLVHAHRDNHPVEVLAQFLASRFLELTGNEMVVNEAMRSINWMGGFLARTVGSVTGSESIEKGVKKLIGVVDRSQSFKFREQTRLSDRELRLRVERAQREARAVLKARGRNPRLQVLLTGATGFLGKEILHQAAGDRRIEEVVAVVRPETLRDPRTRQVVKVLSPAQRGALLLKRLHITGARARKFRFIAGDIEQPNLGIAAVEVEKLGKTLTHVIHCAASVSFDDSYQNSYRANVSGAQNALAFSLAMQEAEGSPFICHIAIETSYIHGRKRRSMAQENALVFPRHFYNNFYELTKAMASIETDRAMVERGLRVVQLLPSIVIGDARTGNNRGDTKVVNAPINAFGRSKQMSEGVGGDPIARAKAWAIGLLASNFPGDPSAELNLVPVDRVVAGILAALAVPEAIGCRIHLATDNRIRSEDVVRITREELGVNVRLTDPTVFRNLTLPLVKGVLTRLNEPKLANALEKLGTIFGGYNEWGQPVHDVGNDVRLLGLPIRRPDTQQAFRMLCRHNKYVQEFGRIRDADEIARRERVWEKAIDTMEMISGHEAGAIGAEKFRELLEREVDLRGFRPRPRPPRAREVEEAAG
ncbi:MAG TPA: SDR family oxidoreductase [Vicinamibacteria bacterium]|nr:SDR family oxidoreductase [Vicinamibacteria bacterium]